MASEVKLDSGEFAVHVPRKVGAGMRTALATMIGILVGTFSVGAMYQNREARLAAVEEKSVEHGKAIVDLYSKLDNSLRGVANEQHRHALALARIEALLERQNQRQPRLAP